MTNPFNERPVLFSELLPDILKKKKICVVE